MSLTMIEDGDAAAAVWEKWSTILLGNRRPVLNLAMKLDDGSAPYGFRLFTNRNGQHCELFPWDIYSAAVQVNKPNGRPHGDTRAAIDEEGNRYLVHRARLMGNSQGHAVTDDEFFVYSGLQRTAMTRRMRAHEDNWTVVARIDGRTDAHIRVDTIAFIRACWNARLAKGIGSALERLSDLGLDFESVPDSGRQGLIGEHLRNIVGGTRVIDPLHDKVVTALRGLLEPAGRWMPPPELGGFQPDAIVRTDSGLVLIEIKSRSDAGSMHNGIGQLMFYPALLNLDVVCRVLLMPEKPGRDQKLQKTLEKIGIELHGFREDSNRIKFKSAFLTIIGLTG